MTRKVEEDDLLLASLLAFVCLADSGGNGVSAFRSRDDTLSAGKEHTSLECFELWNIHTLHQTVLQQLRDDDPSTVVAQTTCMDVAGLEVVT